MEHHDYIIISHSNILMHYKKKYKTGNIEMIIYVKLF